MSARGLEDLGQPLVDRAAAPPPGDDDLVDPRPLDLAQLPVDDFSVARGVGPSRWIERRGEVSRGPVAVLLPVRIRTVERGRPEPRVVEDGARRQARRCPAAEAGMN